MPKMYKNLHCDIINDSTFWSGLEQVLGDIEVICYATNLVQHCVRGSSSFSGFAFAEFEVRFSLDLLVVVGGPAGVSALGLNEGALSSPSGGGAVGEEAT
jgi:hypothetical protein